MKEKIKKQKGFIQIPLLIGIIVSIVVTAGVGYGVFEYHKTSKIVKEAEQLTKEEKYGEAIGKLNLAQVGWFVNNLGIKKQEINNEIEKNKKLDENKSKYNQGLDEFNAGNWQKTIDLLSELPENSFYYQKAQVKIEEAKRKIVEEELSGEKIARRAAEAKAKQEEMERIVKERELTAKEAEEKMMNADNDRDGLTYREELAKGTFDYDVDSDDDGINDKEDIHPTGSGKLDAQYFKWNYNDTPWEWRLSIPEDWFFYYRNKPRLPHGAVYVTYNDPYIKSIAATLKDTANQRGYNGVLFAVSFIQGLPYVEDYYTGYDELPKYPIETLIDRNGDCEDTSYLAAAIIQAMGYGVVLVELPGHMAIAIKRVPEIPGVYYLLDGDHYYYYETTAEGWELGDIPDDYRYTSAKLVKIPSNEIVSNVNPNYKKRCDSSSIFSGYYYDGTDFYSDNQCNSLAFCLYYQGYYYNYKAEAFYHDSNCTQLVVKGCYKSKSYPGYFYRSGLAWYYDSQCLQIYQSMTCNYPYSYSYSCTSEYSYESKKSTCDYYASSKYLKDLAQSCYDGLAKCRSDINEYQSKLNEYNSCLSRKEY